MRFVPQQYVPVDASGTPIIQAPGLRRLMYQARSFSWMECPLADASQYRLKLEELSPMVEWIFRVIDENLAKKADCERRRMGCVVTDRHLTPVGFGFNSKPKDLAGSCQEVGCVPALTCRLTDHAEAVALREVLPQYQEGGLVLFNTAVPCLTCLKRCGECNVRTIVYKEARIQDEFDRPILSALSMTGRFLFLRMEE